jgi:hypothetical protein
MTELIVAFRIFANSSKNSVPASQWHRTCLKYTLFFILYREIVTKYAILLRGDSNYFWVDSLAFHIIWICMNIAVSTSELARNNHYLFL